LKLLAKERGLADRVIFAGNRTQEWIAGALNFADINLAPLCGRSLLEASLGGVPTIAFDVDWHSEIVIPGVTGILVPDLDFSAMEAAILQLSEDSQLRIKMGTNVHDKAISLASPEEIARKQFAIYKNLVRKPV
jgi:glycosyltransferase involved in cell wall biosynthesis